MNFLPHHKIGKSDAGAPRLIPSDHYPAEPIPGLPRPTPADSDLSFEDALADIQFSRFLHAEYDVQAPAQSLARLMAAIHAEQQPAASPAPVTHARKSPLHGLAFAWKGLLSVLARPAATRIASGVIAIMIMAAAIVPNVSMVIKDAPTHRDASQSMFSGRGDYTGPPLQQVLPRVVSLNYDRVMLLQSDPPDTLVPPKHNIENVTEPQGPSLGTPRSLLRKE